MAAEASGTEAPARVAHVIRSPTVRSCREAEDVRACTDAAVSALEARQLARKRAASVAQWLTAMQDGKQEAGEPPSRDVDPVHAADWSKESRASSTTSGYGAEAARAMLVTVGGCAGRHCECGSALKSSIVRRDDDNKRRLALKAVNPQCDRQRACDGFARNQD